MYFSVSENEGNTEHYTGEQEVKNLELQLLTQQKNNGQVIRYMLNSK